MTKRLTLQEKTELGLYDPLQETQRKRKYISTEHAVEDILIEEKEAVCLDPYSYGLTLSVALARLSHGLPVRAKVVNGFAQGVVLVKKGAAHG